MQEKDDEGETLYASARHLFAVRRVDGKLILTTVCGTVGLSMASKELTPQEIAAFHEDPEQLAESARELCEQWAAGALPPTS